MDRRCTTFERYGYVVETHRVSQEVEPNGCMRRSITTRRWCYSVQMRPFDFQPRSTKPGELVEAVLITKTDTRNSEVTVAAGDGDYRKDT